MGNRRHPEPDQSYSAPVPPAAPGVANPLVFKRSDPARIEQIMRANLIEFTAQVEQYNSPTNVLDALDDAIAEDVSLMVLGAKRFGVDLNDRDRIRLGENVFLHKSVPDGWW